MGLGVVGEALIKISVGVEPKRSWPVLLGKQADKYKDSIVCTVTRIKVSCCSMADSLLLLLKLP